MFSNKRVGLLARAILGMGCFVGLSVGLAGQPSARAGSMQELVGYFSDTQDAFKKDADHSKHIASGAKPLFVVGKKAYPLENPPQYQNYFGKIVNVSASVDGDALVIKGIKKGIKVGEKDGPNGGRPGGQQK